MENNKEKIIEENLKRKDYNVNHKHLSLIKSNNENLMDSDIKYLINEAKELSSSKKNSNNGKGISVSYIDYGDKKEWQVIRLYK